MRMRCLIAAAAGWVVALGLMGCGSSSVRVATLTPTLQITAGHMLGGTVKVAVEPFEVSSDPLKKNIIGKAQTGLVNSDADIVVDEPVGSIVTNVMKSAFKKAGFVVTERSSADYVVHGKVERLWVDEYATGMSLEYSKAQAKIEVLLDDAAGKTLWASTLDKYETSGTALDATEGNIPTLTKALQSAVESLFRDDTFWKAISR
jgi:hypothetical protein